MRSSFFEFNVAVSGLFTAKSGLSVAAHNVSNASTLGYSRQYAIQQANSPLATYNHKGMVGTGSSVVGIGQIRSFYLDQKYWGHSATLGQYTTKVSQLSLAEISFNELSGVGLTKCFTDFFSRLQDLSTSAPEGTYRRSVIGTAQSLVTNITGLASSLRSQQLDVNTEIKTMVSQINNIGDQIRDLNEKIYKFESLGSNANDLRDQRALLVDQLSRLVNVEVSETQDGKYFVMINGAEFVSHYDVNTLSVIARDTKRNDMDADGLYDIRFSNGTTFDIYSSSLKGELRGLIDVRDGNGGDSTVSSAHHTAKGIPYYLNQLNELIRVFAQSINEGVYDDSGVQIIKGHEDGFDANGDQKGYAFFNFVDEFGVEQFGGLTYGDMNVFNFQINSKILEDENLLACASEANLGESDNNIILGFVEIANYQHLFKQGTITDFVTAMIGELGIDVEESKNFELSYSEIVGVTDNQRLQVSGVSLNEEIVSMLQYQQQYQAASKLMSVISDLYDRMINQMGV